MKNNIPKYFGVIIYILIIYLNNCVGQIESVFDSHYKKFNIGFKIEINANQIIKIKILNEDSSICNILIDSTFRKKQKIVFLFDNYIESEKSNFLNYLIIPISYIESGIYFLDIFIREKFVLTK